MTADIFVPLVALVSCLCALGVNHIFARHAREAAEAVYRKRAEVIPPLRPLVVQD